MTDIKKLLQDADPLRAEDALSPAEAQVLRTAMLEAATAPRRTGSIWHRPLAVAAIAIVVIGIGGATGDRALAPDYPPTSDSASRAVGDAGQTTGNDERRQIQFATPGGTRIIWILDPNLPLQESMP